MIRGGAYERRDSFGEVRFKSGMHSRHGLEIILNGWGGE